MTAKQFDAIADTVSIIVYVGPVKAIELLIAYLKDGNIPNVLGYVVKGKKGSQEVHIGLDKKVLSDGQKIGWASFSLSRDGKYLGMYLAALAVGGFVMPSVDKRSTKTVNGEKIALDDGDIVRSAVSGRVDRAIIDRGAELKKGSQTPVAKFALTYLYRGGRQSSASLTSGEPTAVDF